MSIRLYLLHLNPEAKGSLDRYAVMRAKPDGTMVPLWGHHFDTERPGAGKKAAQAWPFMAYHRRPAHGPDRYPAFHFVMRGYGYSKVHELARALADHLGQEVTLTHITGWRSSETHAEPAAGKRQPLSHALKLLGEAD